MTAAELLTEINSHITHQGQDSERYYLPDIFTLIDPSLLSMARRIARSKDLSNYLVKEFSPVNLTDTDGVYSATLPTDLLNTAPYRALTVDGSRILYASFPITLVFAECANLKSSYYSVAGNKVTIVLKDGSDADPVQAVITGVFIPTLATLPDQLKGQLIDEVILRLGATKQGGVRK